MPARTPKTQRKFSNWEIIQDDMNFVFRDKVLCRCVCWREKRITYSSLYYNMAKNCWCIWYKIASEKATKHWLSNNRIWDVYQNMKKRCNRDIGQYYYLYGWRWIKCLWMTFEDFISDMYESYLEHCKLHWEKNTTIERMDNNWHYCKQNCIRATRQVQANNRRCVNKYEYNWEYVTVFELADKLSLNKYTLKSYIYDHWYDKAKSYYWF